MSSKEITPLPFSWTFKNWPEDVAPFTPAAAYRLYLKNKDALYKAGAVTRIGRTVSFYAKEYDKWCRQQSNRVVTFQPSFNSPEAIAKRNTPKAIAKRTKAIRAGFKRKREAAQAEA